MPGNIVGFVQVFDTLSNLMNDNSGVKVSLPGTSYSAMSDATGRWQLTNVPPGTYKIFFSKPGCSGFEDFNVAFQGNGSYYYGYNAGKQSIVFIDQLQNLYPDIVLRPFEDNMIIQDSAYYDSTGYYHYVYDTTIVRYYSAIFSSRLQPSQFNNYSVSTAMYFGKTRTIDPMDPKTFLFVPG